MELYVIDECTQLVKPAKKRSLPTDGIRVMIIGIGAKAEDVNI